MNCERCRQNPATQAVRAEKNGKPCELFVCDACARESAKAPGAVSLADILFSLGAPGAPNAPAETAAPATVAREPDATAQACAVCGLTRDVLRDRRRFGCPVCYETFADDVRAFVRELQYGDSHVGRTPRRNGLKRRLAALDAELATAIAAQRYEEAARLRDTIRKLQADAPQNKESPDGEA